MNSPENTIDRRSTDYKNRLRSACSGLRTPADRRKRPTAHLIDVLTEETAMSPTPPEPEMTVETALARLRQYQVRPAKTWSTATYTSSDEQALAAIAHTLAEAVKGPFAKEVLRGLGERSEGLSGNRSSAANRIVPAIQDILVKWQDPEQRARAELVGVDLPQSLADAIVKEQQRQLAADEFGAVSLGWIIDRLARRATLYGDSETVRQVMIDLKNLADSPGLAPNDTLGAWLYRRFSKSISPAWVSLPDEEKDYWEHEADAVRRAVARGGFKNTDADHRPTLVHFGNRHSVPAEVCWGCSDEDAGRWVPVTQCTTARAQMAEGPGSLYASSVVIPHPEGDGHG